MPVADLPSRLPDAWSRATRHPFLDAVRDGTVDPAAFDTWLVQDARFIADLLRFQARLLARAPRPAQAVLAAGLVALVEELDWFERLAADRGLDLGAPPLPATVAYGALLERLDGLPVPEALAALWAVERVYLDAWTSAAPGGPAHAEFVAHWTTPGFAGYVTALERAADAVAGNADPAGAVGEVLVAEAAFWDMAVLAAERGPAR
ncbi:thiaminase II/PqqC family protein [Blastococcus sp. SYSU D00820]